MDYASATIVHSPIARKRTGRDSAFLLIDRVRALAHTWCSTRPINKIEIQEAKKSTSRYTTTSAIACIYIYIVHKLRQARTMFTF